MIMMFKTCYLKPHGLDSWALLGCVSNFFSFRLRPRVQLPTHKDPRSRAHPLSRDVLSVEDAQRLLQRFDLFLAAPHAVFICGSWCRLGLMVGPKVGVFEGLKENHGQREVS